MIAYRRLAGGVLGGVLCVASFAEAFTVPPAHDYYGDDFQREFRAGHGIDKKTLHVILKSFHVTEPGKADQIVDICPDRLRPGQTCYERRSLSYKEARTFLFGDPRFHLRIDGSGDYFVRGVYCRREYTNRDFGGRGIGPGQIPDQRHLNTEHTWPQSRFSKSPKGFMKSDLHHLFPTNSKANAIRGNHPFGEVEEEGRLPAELNCDASRVGRLRAAPGAPGQGRSATYFEPPDEHKGNVARALFYFAARYDMTIDPTQEFFLRRWHEQDPVDEEEQIRHDGVYSLQKVRNPFIDYPELVTRIQDF